MMKGALAAAAAVLACAPGVASVYAAHIVGTITEENPGSSDPSPLKVGDQAIFEARFDLSKGVRFLETDYWLYDLYNLPKSGAEYFRLTLGGFTYGSLDQWDDGAPSYFAYLAQGVERSVGNPMAIMKDGRLVGVSFTLMPFDNAPGFTGGSSAEGVYDCHPYEGSTCSASGKIVVSNRFMLGDNFYVRDGGQYLGPHFVGSWSFSVPEPAAWALLLVGFGAVGLAGRRRRLLPA